MTAAAEIVALSFGLLAAVALVFGVLVAMVRHAWHRRRTYAEIRAHANDIHHRRRPR